MKVFSLSVWISLCLLAFTLLLSACKEPVDVTPPRVEVLAFDPAPRSGIICGSQAEQVFFVANGQKLDLDLVFHDETGLSQYKIDIHSNFDCHGHARANTVDWSVLEVLDLSGTEQRVTRSLEVPENVTAGAYHFQIQVIDAAGNEDPFANYYDIVVVNQQDTLPPVLSVAQPASQNITVNKGAPLRFAGTVADNLPLGDGGNGRLLLTYRRSDSENRFEAQEITWEPGQGDRAAFDFEFVVPNTLVSGTYTFVLSAYDGVNNESERQRFTVAVE